MDAPAGASLRIYFELLMDSVVFPHVPFLAKLFVFACMRPVAGSPLLSAWVEPVAGHTSCCPSSSPAKAVAA